MLKKLYISLIFSILELLKILIYNHCMHKLYAIFAKYLEICKHFGDNLVNEKGNQARRGVVARFSDLEVIALSLPHFGYCASQGVYYYGYKLQAVCGISGVIHSFDLTKASVHYINYLNDVRYEYHDCSILGDRGYISASMLLDLLETTHIKLEYPYRLNQKNWKPTFISFAQARKRIENVFFQMCDQFMIGRSLIHKKQTDC